MDIEQLSDEITQRYYNSTWLGLSVLPDAAVVRLLENTAKTRPDCWEAALKKVLDNPN